MHRIGARISGILHKWLEPELFQPFVLGLFIVLMISEFVRGALTLSMLPTYGRTVLGFAVEYTALALSIHFLTDNLLRAPAGWLADRIGQRLMLLFAFGLAVISLLWMMRARTIGTFILSLALYGVAVTPVWPSAISGLSKSTPDRKRGVFMSYLNIFWLVGAGLGPVAINFVIGRTYQAAFWLLLTAAAVAFCVAFLLVRPSLIGRTLGGGFATRGTDGGTDRATTRGSSPTPGRAARPGATWGPEPGPTPVGTTAMGSAPVATAEISEALVPNWPSGAAGADGDGRSPSASPRKSVSWHDLWHNIREVAFLFPGMFAQTFAVSSLIPILSLYAKVVLRMSGEMYSMVLVAGGAITVFLLIPTGKLVDRIGPRIPLVSAFIIAGTGLGLYPFFHTWPLTYAVVCLFGLCYAFILPAWNAVLDGSIDPDKKGALWGVFMTVEGLGSAAGPYLGGLMWDRINPSAPFWVSAGVIVVMGILYTMLPIRGRRPTGAAAR